MRVRIVKEVRVAGEDYYPGDVPDFDEDTVRRLIERGYGVKEQTGLPHLCSLQ